MLDKTNDETDFQDALKGVSQVGISAGPFALLQNAAERQAALIKSLMETNQATYQIWQKLGQQSFLAAQQSTKLWTNVFLSGLKQGAENPVE